MIVPMKNNYREPPQSALSRYLCEIGRFSPLTREEEKRLATIGDKKALNSLVERNLKYAVMVANQYKGLGLAVGDLINEGNIGLIEAAKRFDPERGVKFITYAVWWVRQSILRALAEQGKVVRLPVKQAGQIKKITGTISTLTKELKREPAIEEVAKKLGLKTDTVVAIMRVYHDYLSLDSPISEGSNSTFLEKMADKESNSPETEFIRLCLHRDLEQMINKLPEREAKIIRLRYGFNQPPMTLAQIGALMGLTRERVRQIEKVAKRKLRARTNIKILEDYLR